MTVSIHHTGLVVRDLESMVSFYTEVVGLNLLAEVDSIAPASGDHTGVSGARRRLVFVGETNGGQIELVKYDDPGSPSSAGLDRHQLGSLHLCFRIDNLEETHQRLSARGVRFLTEPVFREMHGRRVGVVYAQDPEDNWIEFLEMDG